MIFSVKTKGFNDITDITPQISQTVKDSHVEEGFCLVSSPGSTCGITTIEAEPELLKDFKDFLEKIVPSDIDYRHDRVWGEKNGFSHILSALIPPFLTIPIENKKLILGTWQQVIFIDFDSKPRERKIMVKITRGQK